jgi:hypothetical protein|tara:strand:+ start:123 stop:266 length:144 start_codon:yes stop_codon:yes gene_type:complete
MAFTYRKKMTPGIKMCRDFYVEGKKVKKEEPKIETTPPQHYKVKANG